MQGHGLRGVFNAQGRTHAAAFAHRIGGIQMGARGTDDVVGVHGLHCLQQAHAALMRNAGRDLALAHQHGVTSTCRY